MKKIALQLILFSTILLLVNCKKEEKSIDFTALTKSYFTDKNALDPLSATFNGLNEFNDKLEFEMTDSYAKKQSLFIDKYEKELTAVDTTKLSEEEKISYHIIEWECKIGKELLKQPANLMPVHQFWGTHLVMGQLAGGTGAQPFKTEKDYTNFLKRMDKYAVWIDSAMVYMKKGIKKGAVLPKALTIKMIPQFAEMPTPKIEDNLFYSAIKLMPNTFYEAVKKDLTAKYTATIKCKFQ